MHDFFSVFPSFNGVRHSKVKKLVNKSFFSVTEHIFSVNKSFDKYDPTSKVFSSSQRQLSPSKILKCSYFEDKHYGLPASSSPFPAEAMTAGRGEDKEEEEREGTAMVIIRRERWTRGKNQIMYLPFLLPFLSVLLKVHFLSLPSLTLAKQEKLVILLMDGLR